MKHTPLRIAALAGILLLSTIVTFLATRPACAGTYSISYSGGAFTFSGPQRPGFKPWTGPKSVPYSGGGGGWGESISSPWPWGNVCSCSGPITTTFTFQPAFAGEQPPQCVVVMQTCTAWTTMGTASTGLANSVPATNGFTSTVYSVHSGGTFTLTTSPSASGSSPGGWNWQGGVFYSASVTPVLINLTGPITDASGLETLVGQGITGSMSAGSCTLSNFQWSVSGNTFAGLYVAPAYPPTIPAQTFSFETFVPSVTWTSASPHWYWSDNDANWGGFEKQTVDATATAIAADGTNLGQVTAENSVNLWAPTASMEQDPTTSPSSYVVDVLHVAVGVTSTSDGTINGEGSGVQFSVVATTPTLFPPGKLSDAQLVSRTDWATGGFLLPADTNGYALDTSYPDLETGIADGTFGNDLTFSDSPSMSFGAAASSFGVDQLFKHYTLFTPQGTDVTAVPLWEVHWTWLAQGNLSSGVWLPDPPGRTAIVSSTYGQFLPTWQQLVVGGSVYP